MATQLPDLLIKDSHKEKLKWVVTLIDHKLDHETFGECKNFAIDFYKVEDLVFDRQLRKYWEIKSIDDLNMIITMHQTPYSVKATICKDIDNLSFEIWMNIMDETR